MKFGKIKKIKKEVAGRLAGSRFRAMLVYGVVYALLLNLALITDILFLNGVRANIYTVIFSAAYAALLLLAAFLLVGFLVYGMTGFYLKAYNGKSTEPFNLFDGFQKPNFTRVAALHLIKTGITLGLTLLLIVPGIIFSLMSAFSFYLLRSNPDMKAFDAVKMSAKLTKGHRFELFCLALSFVGWFLFGVLTLGLGFIWVLPYFNSCKTVFYKRVIQGDTAVYAPQANGAAEGSGQADVNEPNSTGWAQADVNGAAADWTSADAGAGEGNFAEGFGSEAGFAPDANFTVEANFAPETKITVETEFMPERGFTAEKFEAAEAEPTLRQKPERKPKGASFSEFDVPQTDFSTQGGGQGSFAQDAEQTDAFAFTPNETEFVTPFAADKADESPTVTAEPPKPADEPVIAPAAHAAAQTATPTQTAAAQNQTATPTQTAAAAKNQTAKAGDTAAMSEKFSKEALKERIEKIRREREEKLKAEQAHADVKK